MFTSSFPYVSPCWKVLMTWCSSMKGREFFSEKQRVYECTVSLLHYRIWSNILLLLGRSHVSEYWLVKKAHNSF